MTQQRSTLCTPGNCISYSTPPTDRAPSSHSIKDHRRENQNVTFWCFVIHVFVFVLMWTHLRGWVRDHVCLDRWLGRWSNRGSWDAPGLGDIIPCAEWNRKMPPQTNTLRAMKQLHVHLKSTRHVPAIQHKGKLIQGAKEEEERMKKKEKNKHYNSVTV